MKLLSSAKQKVYGYLARHRAAILTYHSVLDRPAPYPLYCHMLRDDFERQMQYLVANRNCISVAQLIADVKQNRIQEYSVAITFDDGFANNLKVALPILEKYRIPATFFIAPGFVHSGKMIWPEVVASILASSSRDSVAMFGRELRMDSIEAKAASHRWLMAELKARPHAEIDIALEKLATAADLSMAEAAASLSAQQFAMLTPQELRMLAKSPLVEVGAHTVNHSILTRMSIDEARDEIVRCKHMLEEEVGPVRYFAYPNGGVDDYNIEHRQIAIDAGYEAVFTAQMGAVVAGADIYSLKRIGMGAWATPKDLAYGLNEGMFRSTEV